MLRNLAHMLFISLAPRHRLRVVEDEGQMLPVLECIEGGPCSVPLAQRDASES